MQDGDYLFYADAGSFFIKNIEIILDKVKTYKQDVFGFELPLIESQWTKQELFLEMNCNESKYKNSNQMNSSFHFVRKSDKSVSFYKEYLSLASDVRNLTGLSDPNVKQDADFIEHRYDQSIYSLLYKKHNLHPFKDPSQFGQYPEKYTGTLEHKGEFGCIHTSATGIKYRYNRYEHDYELLIFHNRTKNPISSQIKYWIKDFLLKLGLYKNSF
jgi:hypothetical protein